MSNSTLHLRIIIRSVSGNYEAKVCDYLMGTMTLCSLEQKHSSSPDLPTRSSKSTKNPDYYYTITDNLPHLHYFPVVGADLNGKR